MRHAHHYWKQFKFQIMHYKLYITQRQSRTLQHLRKKHYFTRQWMIHGGRGGCTIFSRREGGGGGGLIFKKFCRLFFLIFRALPKHGLVRFGQIFCAASKILKKQSKKAFLGTFWKILTKKIAFFRRALPSQNWYILAPKAPLKNLRVGRKKMDFLKSTKGGRIPEGEGGGFGVRPLPPKSAPTQRRSCTSLTGAR